MYHAMLIVRARTQRHALALPANSVRQLSCSQVKAKIRPIIQQLILVLAYISVLNMSTSCTSSWSNATSVLWAAILSLWSHAAQFSSISYSLSGPSTWNQSASNQHVKYEKNHADLDIGHHYTYCMKIFNPDKRSKYVMEKFRLYEKFTTPRESRVL